MSIFFSLFGIATLLAGGEFIIGFGVLSLSLPAAVSNYEKIRYERSFEKLSKLKMK